MSDAQVRIKSAQSLVEILTPLTAEERTIVIRTAMSAFNEAVPRVVDTKSGADSANEDSGTFTGINMTAQVWLKRNNITKEQLDQVFHITAESTGLIVDDVPGKSTEKVQDVYVLTGVLSFLQSGNMKIEDKKAKELCKKFNCFDSNHSKRMNCSYFIESKNDWELTALGLKRGVELIKVFNEDMKK